MSINFTTCCRSIEICITSRIDPYPFFQKKKVWFEKKIKRVWICLSDLEFIKKICEVWKQEVLEWGEDFENLRRGGDEETIIKHKVNDKK